MQQEEENLPYEEEIYKDSSTFLKVNNFQIFKFSCFSFVPKKILNTYLCLRFFFQLLKDHYCYKIKYHLKSFMTCSSDAWLLISVDNWIINYHFSSDVFYFLNLSVKYNYINPYIPTMSWSLISFIPM